MATSSEHKTNGNRPRSVVEIVDEEVAQGRRTLTPLGRELLEARREIEKSDIPLLTLEQLEKELDDLARGVTDE